MPRPTTKLPTAKFPATKRQTPRLTKPLPTKFQSMKFQSTQFQTLKPATLSLRLRAAAAALAGAWLLAAPAHATEAQTIPANLDSVSSDVIAPALATTLQQADATTQHKVIVQFAVAAGLADRMEVGGTASGRKRAVGLSRRAFIRSIPLRPEGGGRSLRRGLKRSLTYLPFMAYEGTAAEIAAISANANVLSITEDLEVQTMLPESTVEDRANAVSHYDIDETGAGWTVAVLDTGVAQTHNAFGSGRIVAEACTSYSGCSIGSGPGAGGVHPTNPQYHGTHVAGIVLSEDAVNRGMAPAANLISVRVLPGTLTDVVEGLEYVYSQKNNFNIAAVNMSLGVPSLGFNSDCDWYSPAIAAAIDLLASADIAVVVSSGNDGFRSGVSLPACMSNAIAVGATNDLTDAVAAFSNSGALLDLLAPGEWITSAWYPPRWFNTLQGTSMAAPHVAGAFALIRAAISDANTEEILDALQNNGEPVRDYRNGITRTRIDSFAAADAIAPYSDMLQIRARFQLPFPISPVPEPIICLPGEESPFCLISPLPLPIECEEGDESLFCSGS